MPIRSLLQDTLGICVCSISATVSCFFLTMLYTLGYWSHRDLLPNNMSSENLIWDPSFIMKVPNLSKPRLTFIKLAQKCEYPLFHWTCTSDLIPRYLLRMICCHVPSVKAMFLSSRLCIPSLLGPSVDTWYSILLANILFCVPHAAQKKERKQSNFLWNRYGISKKDIMYMGNC